MDDMNETFEDGEIRDSSSENENAGGSGSVVYQVVERPSVPAGAMRSVPPAESPSPPKYRSCPGIKHSSSESDSDDEENTALWRQKQKKYFRNQKDASMACSSSSRSEYQQTKSQSGASSGDSSQSAAKKKVNNIWGSVIQEQDLTQILVKSGSVNHVEDYNERTVESYDFTNKYKDSRRDVAEPEARKETDTHDPFEKVISAASGKRRADRSIIDYEDSMDMDSQRRNKNRNRNNRKRKRDPSEDKTGGVHDRLGAKKLTTTPLGPVDISVDMEDGEVAKKIADCLNEPKVELIERVIQALGKEVAIRILNMTRDVEEAGGMMTFDGSRRRTAGGVYLQMLKQQPECTVDSKKIIFQEDYEERLNQKKQLQKRKKHQKKRQKERKKRFGKDGKSENAALSKSRSESPASRGDNSDGESEDEDNNDQRLKGRNSSRKEPISFQDELAAAKEQILARSRSREAEDMEADVGGELKAEDKENLDDGNDLEEAGASVVDIELEMP